MGISSRQETVEDSIHSMARRLHGRNPKRKKAPKPENPKFMELAKHHEKSKPEIRNSGIHHNSVVLTPHAFFRKKDTEERRNCKRTRYADTPRTSEPVHFRHWQNTSPLRNSLARTSLPHRGAPHKKLAQTRGGDGGVDLIIFTSRPTKVKSSKRCGPARRGRRTPPRHRRRRPSQSMGGGELLARAIAFSICLCSVAHLPFAAVPSPSTPQVGASSSLTDPQANLQPNTGTARIDVNLVFNRLRRPYTEGLIAHVGAGTHTHYWCDVGRHTLCVEEERRRRGGMGMVLLVIRRDSPHICDTSMDRYGRSGSVPSYVMVYSYSPISAGLSR